MLSLEHALFQLLTTLSTMEDKTGERPSLGESIYDETLLEKLLQLGPSQMARVAEIMKHVGSPEAVRLKAEYDAIYGPDPHSSPKWKPDPNFPHIKSISIPEKFPPTEDFDLLHNIRGFLYWSVLIFLEDTVLDGRTPVFDYLYDPSIQIKGMEKAAYFRTNYIYPKFRSVEAFHDHLLQLKDDLKDPLYLLSPQTTPEMTSAQVLDLFKQAGDEKGQLLLGLHQDLYGEQEELLDEFCDLASIQRDALFHW